MLTDLDGLIANACDELTRGHGTSSGGIAAALHTLAANLRELCDRTEAGDLSSLDEFFGIYVFEGRGAYARPMCEGEPARRPAGTSTETPPEGVGPTSGPVALRCYVCGSPATCIGRYEGHGPIRGGCDEHCGHGNEDGWCDPPDEVLLDTVETAIALQEAEARLADAELRVALWSGAPVEGWTDRGYYGADPSGHRARIPGFKRDGADSRVALLKPPPVWGEGLWAWEGRRYRNSGRVSSTMYAGGSDPDPLVCLRAAEAWLSEVPRPTPT